MAEKDNSDDEQDHAEEEISHGEKRSGTGAEDEFEAKKHKRLELNRKAAQESRRRKKLRIEELQRSVVFLTSENNQLREQNEMLRQMLTAEVPTDDASAINRAQAENAALKLALYESVQNLAKQTAAPRLPIGVPEGALQPPTAALMQLLGAQAGRPAGIPGAGIPGVPAVRPPGVPVANPLLAQLAGIAGAPAAAVAAIPAADAPAAAAPV